MPLHRDGLEGVDRVPERHVERAAPLELAGPAVVRRAPAVLPERRVGEAIVGAIEEIEPAGRVGRALDDHDGVGARRIGVDRVRRAPEGPLVVAGLLRHGGRLDEERRAPLVARRIALDLRDAREEPLDRPRRPAERLEIAGVALGAVRDEEARLVEGVLAAHLILREIPEEPAPHAVRVRGVARARLAERREGERARLGEEHERVRQRCAGRRRRLREERLHLRDERLERREDGRRIVPGGRRAREEPGRRGEIARGRAPRRELHRRRRRLLPGEIRRDPPLEDRDAERGIPRRVREREEPLPQRARARPEHVERAPRERDGLGAIDLEQRVQQIRREIRERRGRPRLREHGAERVRERARVAEREGPPEQRVRHLGGRGPEREEPLRPREAELALPQLFQRRRERVAEHAPRDDGRDGLLDRRDAVAIGAPERHRRARDEGAGRQVVRAHRALRDGERALAVARHHPEIDGDGEQRGRDARRAAPGQHREGLGALLHRALPARLHQRGARHRHVHLGLREGAPQRAERVRLFLSGPEQGAEPPQRARVAGHVPAGPRRDVLAQDLQEIALFVRAPRRADDVVPRRDVRGRQLQELARELEIRVRLVGAAPVERERAPQREHALGGLLRGGEPAERLLERVLLQAQPRRQPIQPRPDALRGAGLHEPPQRPRREVRIGQLVLGERRQLLQRGDARGALVRGRVRGVRRHPDPHERLDERRRIVGVVAVVGEPLHGLGHPRVGHEGLGVGFGGAVRARERPREQLAEREVPRGARLALALLRVHGQPRRDHLAEARGEEHRVRLLRVLAAHVAVEPRVEQRAGRATEIALRRGRPHALAVDGQRLHRVRQPDSGRVGAQDLVRRRRAALRHRRRERARRGLVARRDLERPQPILEGRVPFAGLDPVLRGLAVRRRGLLRRHVVGPAREHPEELVRHRVPVLQRRRLAQRVRGPEGVPGAPEEHGDLEQVARLIDRFFQLDPAERRRREGRLAEPREPAPELRADGRIVPEREGPPRRRRRRVELGGARREQLRDRQVRFTFGVGVGGLGRGRGARELVGELGAGPRVPQERRLRVDVGEHDLADRGGRGAIPQLGGRQGPPRSIAEGRGRRVAVGLCGAHGGRGAKRPKRIRSKDPTAKRSEVGVSPTSFAMAFTARAERVRASRCQLWAAAAGVCTTRFSAGTA